MAGEIYIADKTTLDSVKQDTNYIKQQFPIYNPLKYQPLQINKQYSLNNTDGTKVLFEVNGAGYIHTVLFTECYARATIEVDGKIIFQSGLGLSSSALCCGIVNSNSLYFNKTPWERAYSMGCGLTAYNWRVPIPYISPPDQNYSTVAFLDDKLYFNNNLKITIQSIEKSIANTDLIFYGGIYAE